MFTRLNTTQVIFWLLLLAVAAIAQTAEQAQHPPTQKPQETEAKKPDPQNLSPLKTNTVSFL